MPTVEDNSPPTTVKGNNDFPYDIQDVEKELAEELMKCYTEKTGFVRIGPKGYFFPYKFKEWAAEYYNLPLRDDDTFVVTFPRSGTTWTQELVWLLQNNLDFEQAKSKLLIQRFPYVDHASLIHSTLEKELSEICKGDSEKSKMVDMLKQPGTEEVANMPSPRFIKSHLPLSLLPPTLLDRVKVVYVARDPRDVMVSYYHFCQINKILGGPDNFKVFWEYFLKGYFYYAPILEHVKEAWNMRHHPNMMFIFYEELFTDLSGTIKKVASFLGKHYSDDQIEQLREYLSFDKFKNNTAVNLSFTTKIGLFTPGSNFVRKGIAGDWKNYFDDEMLEVTNKWMRENLKDTDLKYPSYVL